jgi:hypothetical protein
MIFSLFIFNSNCNLSGSHFILALLPATLFALNAILIYNKSLFV